MTEERPPAQGASLAEPPRAEFESRWERAQEVAATRGLEGLVVVSRGASNVDSYADAYYLSNHFGNHGYVPDYPGCAGRSHTVVVLPPHGEPTLIVDGPDWRKDRVAIADVRFALDIPAAVAAALDDHGVSEARLGLVGLGVMSARFEGQLRDRMPRVTFEACDDLIENLRLVKSPLELEFMRVASDVGSKVVDEIMSAALVPGTLESEAVAAGYALGVASEVAFYDAAVASGPYSGAFTYGHLPSWSGRTLNEGDLFHVDCYGAVNGYLFDIGRTCVVGGTAKADVLDLLETAIAAVDAGLAAVRPGVTAGAVHAVVKRTLEQRGTGSSADAGMTEGFPPFGHGFGLGWEPPWILPGDETELDAGMCLALETMPGNAEIGYVYFEQNFVVTEGGTELLTSTPKRYWEP